MKEENPAPLPTQNIAQLPTKPVTRQTVVIGLSDKALAEEIAQQIDYFGYDTIFSEDLTSIIALIKSQPPDKKLSAIILDTAFCRDRKLATLKIITEHIPTIFFSTQQDVATRLFTVQAGGQAFFVQPLEFTSLIEKIDQIVMPKSESQPYRILLIEDSLTQARIIQKHLINAGMITELLTDPLKMNEVLTEFQPELILLDLYMPSCQGTDLAKVIRQQDAFVSIPIVFLSAENDPKKQLHAMRGGGDDFLTKHITPAHLIDVVITRVERSRLLRSEMILDSLTGLLNHTRILEQLELEIARAKRNHTELSFAMIDIDFFKAINDSHGHPVGDRVIKGLARLLKQRLRKIDSIGRYGGEEFAIILPQSSSEATFTVLEKIRRGFSKLRHRTQDPQVEFTATFSAGLAEFNLEVNTLDKLVQAADRALYQAKAQGRNAIITYQPGPPIQPTKPRL